MQEKVFFTILFILSSEDLPCLYLLSRFCFSDFLFREKEKYKYICDDMDSTFAELTGY